MPGSVLDLEGFVVFDDVIGGDEVTRVLEELATAPLLRSRAGARHALMHPAIRPLAHDRRLTGIAREALGEAAQPFRVTLFDKSPAANWLVVWHQDTALPLRQRLDVPGWGPWSVKADVLYAHAPAEALRRVVALRLHLDDSTVNNGPLRVLPGTHRLGVLEDEAVQRLAAERRPVDCPVARGGVLVMRPLLIHASSKSREQAPRRVLHMEYAASTDLGDGLELAIA